MSEGVVGERRVEEMKDGRRAMTPLLKFQKARVRIRVWAKKSSFWQAREGGDYGHLMKPVKGSKKTAVFVFFFFCVNLLLL